MPSVFASLSQLHEYDYQQLLRLFMVFFLIMPILNAVLDSLSVSVTRYELEKLHQKQYGLGMFMRVSLIDFGWAIGFKLAVLLLLYVAAHTLEHTGGTFTVENIRTYWHTLLAIFGSQATVADLWKNTPQTMITLMVSTTLIPTLLHFGLVSINVAYTALGAILKLLALLFRGNARFFATAMSIIILLCMYGLVHFMVITLSNT